MSVDAPLVVTRDWSTVPTNFAKHMKTFRAPASRLSRNMTPALAHM
jgi:hypothetical protein